MREIKYKKGGIQGVVLNKRFVTEFNEFDHDLAHRLQGMGVTKIEMPDGTISLVDAIAHGVIQDNKWKVPCSTTNE